MLGRTNAITTKALLTPSASICFGAVSHGTGHHSGQFDSVGPVESYPSFLCTPCLLGGMGEDRKPGRCS